MSDLFQAPVHITKIETTADNCLKMTVHTTIELPTEHEALLMGLRRKTGWMLFKETEIKPEDIQGLPEFVPDFNEKHPSQRLRAVLYVLWQQGNQQVGFELFYRAKMEEIIDNEKAKLDP